MKKARFWVVVSKDPGSDWGASVPDLPGCVATGRTLDVALWRIKAGIKMHLKGLREDRLQLPQPRSKIPIHAKRSKKEVDFYARIETPIPSAPIQALRGFSEKHPLRQALLRKRREDKVLR